MFHLNLVQCITLLCIFTLSSSIQIQPINISFQNHTYLPRSDRDIVYIANITCIDLEITDTPFMVLILVKDSGRLQCMGSIIDEYHVLTSKECFPSNITIPLPSLMVVAGYRSPYFGRNSQVKFVDKLIKHSTSLAILKLLKPFKFGNTVQPIRIIGPEKIRTNITQAYSDFKPYLTSGFFLQKHGPFRGELMPKGYAYHFRDEGEMIETRTNCPLLFPKSGIRYPLMDENYHFCTEGKSEFCWTAVGSPTVVYMDKMPVQIAVVIFAECKAFKPTPNPLYGSKLSKKGEEPVEYSPFIHIRLDYFYKWIKTNSLIGT